MILRANGRRCSFVRAFMQTLFTWSVQLKKSKKSVNSFFNQCYCLMWSLEGFSFHSLNNDDNVHGDDEDDDDYGTEEQSQMRVPVTIRSACVHANAAKKTTLDKQTGWLFCICVSVPGNILLISDLLLLITQRENVLRCMRINNTCSFSSVVRGVCKSCEGGFLINPNGKNRTFLCKPVFSRTSHVQLFLHDLIERTTIGNQSDPNYTDAITFLNDKTSENIVENLATPTSSPCDRDDRVGWGRSLGWRRAALRRTGAARRRSVWCP